MAVTTVMSSSTFLSIIRDNKLVDENKLQELLRTLSPNAQTDGDALPIADALAEHKLLTRFQANLLLQGKSKSLRITSKYRLLDRLGAGGMGLVYLCEHIRMKRLVALKVLPNSQSKEPGNLERFYREAQAVAALKHPNIVQAYDVDTDNGIHYLVMEFVDGINLEKLVNKHGALEPNRAAHYIAQAASGLQHAAERGLVHRDIKPSNLLIDREGYIKVLDMGLARFFDTKTDNITERFDNNAVIGTADFISPEQALNSHDVDNRADIYSLGCTFYYLLTGKAPYHDANITQKLLLHQIREPVPVEQHVPGIDSGLVEILNKMIAKKPEDRFQTPGEIVAALAPWTDEAIAPPSELPSSPRPGTLDPSGNGSTVSDHLTSPGSPSSRKKPSRPNRGMVTERVTESAIRRMDGLPRKDEEDGVASKRRLIIAGITLFVALGGLILVAVRPWESAKPRDVVKVENPDIDEQPRFELKLPEKKNPVVVEKKPPAPKTVALAPGFVEVKIDAKTARPSVQNGGVRAQPTDLLLFSGPDLAKSGGDNTGMLAAFHDNHLIGIRGGQGTATPIIPYAIVIDGDSKVPNTLLTVESKGGFRLRPLPEADFLVTNTFTDVSPEANVMVRESATLPRGQTTINSLVSALVDYTAADEGSTLRVGSGALLFSAPKLPISESKTPKPIVLGAGKNSFALDFAGRTGYLTLCVDEDMTKGNREFVVHAQVLNLGNEPLVLSGYSGNTLRLDHLANANAKLVVQGMQSAVKDKLFRVNFNANANLGIAKGTVSLNDASLNMMMGATVEIDRSLELVKQGQIAAGNAKGKLRWLGKITGGKLSVSGSGQVTLLRGDNDQNGTEVSGGRLELAAPGGTPAGNGNVNVQSNGTLCGAGIIAKDLIIKGGVLEPGTDDGASLVCHGKVQFERFVPRGGKEKISSVRFHVNGPKSRPLVYVGPAKGQPLDLANAHLQLTLVGGFKPERDAKCVLVENRSGQRLKNNFIDAPQFGTVKTADGNWTAKITYDGNGERGATSGGFDVMLYDFAPVNP